jgi:chitin synthase
MKGIPLATSVLPRLTDWAIPATTTVAGEMPLVNGICVTLYNEPWTQLRDSLVSILVSLEQAALANNTPSFVCIVADGRSCVDPGVLAAMNAAGLLQATPLLKDGVEIHVGDHDISQLLIRWSAQFHFCARAHRVKFVVCLKTDNRGKLDSHVVFFETICARFTPEYCYQIDAGTVLAPGAMAELTAALRKDPRIAAITPCLTPPVPDSAASLIYTWQYHDFALRQAALLPAESLLDVLGVMPGQVSAFRWNALRPRSSATASQPNEDPLWTYLHGVAVHSPLRRLMYLSEDRIIGSALILDREEAWQLRYEPRASALTDYCETVPELLRQRRRWTNSAMVCRLWLLGKWKQLWTHRSRPVASKLRQSLALVLQLLVGAREFIAPAHLLALVAVLGQIAVGGSFAGRVLVIALLVTSILDLLASVREVSTAEPARRRWYRWLAVCMSWSSSLLFLSTLIYTLAPGALFVALVPAIAVFSCMAMILPRKALPVLARTHFAPIQYSLLSNAILGYSLWNMNDASWGTKGLTRAPQDDSAVRQLRRFRRAVLTAWVGANALVLWLATGPGLFAQQLNPVVEVIGLMDLVLASVAFLWLAAKRRRA